MRVSRSHRNAPAIVPGFSLGENYMTSLVKKGYQYSDTVQDQNKEELTCDLCPTIYILGYSHGEKSIRLDLIRKQAQAVIDASHDGHPDILPL